MLNEEVAKYRELSGDTNPNTPISRIGGYLDGYEKALEEEPILEKIRAEIEQTVSRYSISREHGCMGQIEWSDRLIKESEVLQIIDKYREEQEE